MSGESCFGDTVTSESSHWCSAQIISMGQLRSDTNSKSILPTTNRSELTVERAVLIYSILIGENINVEEIIANQIYKFVYKTDVSSSLPFPSIIAALCADAKIPAIAMTP
ncbi:hypothetical protein PIB30_069539 [Stylosanthes scabra]|uniref:Putative plant transposon protein domain-containing protein n=1 Tax=Stylosanthes scabra TaxID=79078 RepID=A0ABU6XL20_9FABA|nr:hypothetical protein [Stylosanthes scabra]